MSHPRLFPSIRVQRFGQDGVALHASPPIVATATNTQHTPSAAFDGQNFLVVWDDDRNYMIVAGTDVFGVRVSPAGTVLDPNGIKIAGGGPATHGAHVVFDGTNYAVAWTAYQSQDDSTYNMAGAAHVSPQGAVLNNFTLVPELYEYGGQSVLSAGSSDNKLFATFDYEGVLSRPFNGSGPTSQPKLVYQEPEGFSMSSGSFDGSPSNQGAVIVFAKSRNHRSAVGADGDRGGHFERPAPTVPCVCFDPIPQLAQNADLRIPVPLSTLRGLVMIRPYHIGGASDGPV
ncbi:hypothetical protein [Polyangium fumosum]|uniref:Uncharacterized protein n=1 Tax=Polyangium fumosum TaxID=889272 RepID=A0A4U1IGS4_9BACT|nr:hypothetical protein [Polyangium fumosum]TKC93003.1 hypothetical protein E8A74_50125 [Polyangium fumosum]